MSKSATHAASHVCGKSAGDPAKADVVGYAEDLLSERSQGILRKNLSEDQRKEQIRVLLLNAMQAAKQSGSPEAIAELESTVEAATKVAAWANLRVQARKLVEKLRKPNRRASQVEDALDKLILKLGRVHSTGGTRRRRSAPVRSTVGIQCNALLFQLRCALEEAIVLGVESPLVERGERLAKRVADKAAKKRATENLEESLQTEQVMIQEQCQRDSNVECTAAMQDVGAVRQRKLLEEAKTSDPTMQHDAALMLHKPERYQACTSAGKASQGKRMTAPAQPSADRQREAAELAVSEAQRRPRSGELRAAQQAIVNARQARVPTEAVTGMERRLTALEQQHLPRLQAEHELLHLMHVAAGTCDEVLDDNARVNVLRSTLSEAERHHADATLVERGAELLERSNESSRIRRNAEDFLSRALARRQRSMADLETLQEAVLESRRCGICTLQAERALSAAWQVQRHRKSAERQLKEAIEADSTPENLEEALRLAKNAGVSAEQVRAASIKLEELTLHRRRCAAAAASLRRELSVIKTEPWQFQHTLRTVQSLKPWTQELCQAVREGEHQLEVAATAEVGQWRTQQELQEQLQAASDSWSSGNLGSSHLEQLSTLIRKARSMRVSESVISEAEQKLQGLQQARRKHAAAERHLRKALDAKDLGKIELALQDLSSLRRGRRIGHDPTQLTGASQGPAESSDHAISLMEEARSTILRLKEAVARRHAASAALQELVDDFGPSAISDVASEADATASMLGYGHAGSWKKWMNDARNALHEAKQSGVPPSLIEHAKMQIQKQKRNHEEQQRALEALQTSLRKANAPTEEIARHLQRVKRSQSAR